MSDRVMSDTGARVEDDPRYATDRAVKAGLPPDFGPEERVMFVRPAFLRGHPVTVVLAVGLPVVAMVIAWFIGAWSAVGWTALVSVPLLWGGLWGVWLWNTRALALEITNKRAVEIRGVLSRSRDEVLLDHIRNVTVRQSFYERVMGIGNIGIASAGQAETEIELSDMPNPRRIREVLDLYRPLD